ncbi:hypothetical protein [Actinomadura opuntiae]|uniref:hypothetical protein n=1 Tax=Actinomadura sp. OS1-43 TaxID=604315 RepID=UPI00255AB47B|nr:hypothetical protein [Actinomadura sp. OS1-43]MDL4813569.1 hypothetical protein [Actinomadura sp. OS1-43]
MSDPQTTRPDPPGPVDWPSADPRPPGRGEPVRAVRRVFQAFGAVLGVQAIAAFAVLLILNSYRRGAAGWLLPLVAVADLAVTLQIGWLAIRDIRLAGGRATGPRRLLTALVLLLVAGAAGGGYLYQRHATAPVRGVLGTPVRDGDLSFTASGPRCGVRIKGISAHGALCRVRLTAANTGSTTLRLDAAAQRLHGDGGAHPGSFVVRRSRKKTYTRSASRTMPAGSSFATYLLFDVPTGFAARALELHATGESRGVRIEIPGA